MMAFPIKKPQLANVVPLAALTLRPEFHAPEMVVDLQQMAAGCCHMAHVEASRGKKLPDFCNSNPFGPLIA